MKFTEALEYDKIRRGCWGKNVFIETSDKTATLTLEDIKATDWEEFVDVNSYVWKKIIADKIICYFWDGNGQEKFVGLLEEFKDDRLCAGYPFKVALGRGYNIRFRYCRPADDYYDESRLNDYIR